MALPQSMDPELRRLIEAAADRSDTTVDEWLERAARLALDNEHADQGRSAGVRRARRGAKPKPLPNAPRLLDGSKMSDAIIEDRR